MCVTHGTPMNYAIFRTAAETLQQRVSAAGRELETISNAIAAELGIPRHGIMGLTPDAIRARPEWRAATLKLENAFCDLRRFNGMYANRFKKEIRAEIDARRNASLQANP